MGVMVPAAWSPSREALKSHHKCALAQVCIHPEMIIHLFCFVVALYHSNNISVIPRW